ncbi:MAG: chemotaxis protein CheW [Lysobacter sp.]|nr:chemotaxis protein CheW [Lysobacter sp.]
MSAPEIDIATPDVQAATDVARIAFRPHRALPWLVLPQGLAMQVLIEAHAVQVPNTRPWFRGVVSQRGNLIPVFDLAEWAGLPPERAEREQIASVNLGAQASACALVCSESPTLTRASSAADATSRHGASTMPEADAIAIPEALAPYISRIFESDLGRAHEFDILRWIAYAAAQVPASGR